MAAALVRLGSDDKAWGEHGTFRRRHHAPNVKTIESICATRDLPMPDIAGPRGG